MILWRQQQQAGQFSNALKLKGIKGLIVKNRFEVKREIVLFRSRAIFFEFAARSCYILPETRMKIGEKLFYCLRRKHPAAKRNGVLNRNSERIPRPANAGLQGSSKSYNG